ncbi:MAG TPA: FHA domain-containing protein [Microthrixaceae bacterium]|nr:FHA domain-containing protein [Microthrixaceae bacterium]
MPHDEHDYTADPQAQTHRVAPPRGGDPTTMRFRGVPDGEPVELDHGLTVEDEATIGALRPGTALLVVMRGPNNGARFLLDADEVSSGRHPDSDIFLDDVTVSRRHAVFVREGQGYLVKDVGSLNGTYVNRRSTEQSTLRNGDEVQIGKYRFVYYAG